RSSRGSGAAFLVSGGAPPPRLSHLAIASLPLPLPLPLPGLPSFEPRRKQSFATSAPPRSPPRKRRGASGGVNAPESPPKAPRRERWCERPGHDICAAAGQVGRVGAKAVAGEPAALAPRLSLEWPAA